MTKGLLIGTAAAVLLAVPAYACGDKKVNKTAKAGAVAVESEMLTAAEFEIEGMGCAGQSASLCRSLKRLAGVADATYDHKRGVAVVRLADSSVKGEDLERAFEKAGYKAKLIVPQTRGVSALQGAAPNN